MTANDKDIELIAEFEEITTTAINMPGCKAVMYFTDRAGKEYSIPLDDVTNIKIVSEGADPNQQSTHRVVTGDGNVDISK